MVLPYWMDVIGSVGGMVFLAGILIKAVKSIK